MITETQIKEIIQSEVYELVETLEVIQAYIFERKDYIIDISPLVKILSTRQGFFYYKDYFLHLRDVAFDYYTIKFNYEEYLLFNSKL